MYRLEREEFLSYPLICLWGLLGFQAGFINSFGFLACGKYISHVTGFGTQIGTALAESKVFLAAELLGFPLFFILGAAVSGFFTCARADRGLRPRYNLVTTSLPIALFFVTLAGAFGLFGAFGESFTSARDFLLLYTLSFLCGTQNGCFATMTKGQIRTTHLTGIATDIGTDLSRWIFGRLDKHERRMVRRANASRLLTFTGFAVGSILSVLTTHVYEYAALLVPTGTALTVSLVIARMSQRMESKVASRPSVNELDQLLLNNKVREKHVFHDALIQ